MIASTSTSTTGHQLLALVFTYTRKVARTLIFTATFNERGNVEAWVKGSHRACPEADLLVIDDSSPDGTGYLLDDLAREALYLKIIHRPEKLGLASAHLMAMQLAQQGAYDHLITMDADGSHQAQQIPELLQAAASFDFVIGSRYRGGAHRAAIGRRLLSWAANSAARTLLPTGLSEYTTSFRVFNRSARDVVLNACLHDEGYAFFLEVVEVIHRAGLTTAEVPIQFLDRVYGSSKIPRTQILRSAGVLLSLWGQRVSSRRRLGNGSSTK